MRRTNRPSIVDGGRVERWKRRKIERSLVTREGRKKEKAKAYTKGRA